MQEKKLVSIIVPIFNVENYLDRCVQSIVEQSYPNMEIILVDDGSKDSSGDKADEWSRKDSRIVVVHRVNGGLSAARNSGLDIAKGDYVLFVDSDDWIHTDMVSVLVNNTEKADIVSCGMLRATENESVPIKWFEEECVFSSEEVLGFLVANEIFTSHVVRNLYPRCVFENIRFPEGKLFEDIRITHKIIMKVDSVIILPTAFYYYFVRDDSISNVVKLVNRLEWYYALKERAEDLVEYGEEYQTRIKSQMAIMISLSMVQNGFTSQEKKLFATDMEEIIIFLKKKETRQAVKKYATKTQYIYYMLARKLSFKAHKVYRLVRWDSNGKK